MLSKPWVFWLGPLLFGLGILIVTAAWGPERAEIGDVVSIHYSLSLDDGSVYFSSAGSEPLRYTLGDGSLLPGFEAALIGMKAGDSKTVRIPYSEAYGPYQFQLVMGVNRNELPEGSQPMVGQQIQATSQIGNPLIMVITDVTESTVTLDANHPLAGQNLTFDIELLAIGGDPLPGKSDPSAFLGWTLITLGVSVFGFAFYKHVTVKKPVAAMRNARETWALAGRTSPSNLRSLRE